jgi:hypothetical protein
MDDSSPGWNVPWMIWMNAPWLIWPDAEWQGRTVISLRHWTTNKKSLNTSLYIFICTLVYKDLHFCVVQPTVTYPKQCQHHPRFIRLYSTWISKKCLKSTFSEWNAWYWDALQRHNTENWKQIFPVKELRSLSPNFHIHVSVSDLYITPIRSAYSAAGKYVDRSYEDPKDWGRAIHFLGIHKWDFRCNVHDPIHETWDIDFHLGDVLSKGRIIQEKCLWTHRWRDGLTFHPQYHTHMYTNTHHHRKFELIRLLYMKTYPPSKLYSLWALSHTGVHRYQNLVLLYVGIKIVYSSRSNVRLYQNLILISFLYVRRYQNRILI